MTRVKGGTVSKDRRRKVLKEAKGYFGSKHRLYKTAQEQVMHSGKYAYRDRRQNKRNFRKLWITRINAACRQFDISYSKFIDGLNKAGIEINRKMLAELAVNDIKAFEAIVKIAKDANEGKVVKKETKAEVKSEEKVEVKAETKKEEKPAAKKAAPAKKTTTTTKKPAAKKTTTTAKKPAAKKTTTTAKKPAAKKTTTAKKSTK